MSPFGFNMKWRKKTHSCLLCVFVIISVMSLSEMSAEQHEHTATQTAAVLLEDSLKVSGCFQRRVIRQTHHTFGTFVNRINFIILHQQHDKLVREKRGQRSQNEYLTTGKILAGNLKLQLHDQIKPRKRRRGAVNLWPINSSWEGGGGAAGELCNHIVRWWCFSSAYIVKEEMRDASCGQPPAKWLFSLSEFEPSVHLISSV